MSPDPYRAPPEPPGEDTEVPASVPVTILAILLGAMLTLLAPRHDCDRVESPSYAPHAWAHAHGPSRR